MACLLAAYRAMNGAGMKPRTELTLMTRPLPRSRMLGSTARVMRIEPKRLVSKSARACSIELSSTRISAPDATKTDRVFGCGRRTVATMLRRWLPSVFGFTRRNFSSVRSVPRFSETNSQPWLCHFAFALFSRPRSACTDLNSRCTMSSAWRFPELGSVSLVGYPGGAIDIWDETPCLRPRMSTRVAKFLAIEDIGHGASILEKGTYGLALKQSAGAGAP